MPWLTIHKCNEQQLEPGEYAAEEGRHNGEDVTRLFCPRCRETLVFLGQGLFGEIRANDDRGGIPGFILPSRVD